MSSLQEFQNFHGAAWGEVVGTPAFGAALALAHKERLDKVVILTDDEIDQHGKIILSDLRGHLQYESVLLGLHEKKEFVFQQLGVEEYPDPIEEAREQNIVEQQRESSTVSVAGSSIQEQLFPQVKPKRGRPPKKGKTK